MATKKNTKAPKAVEALLHEGEKRKNIPTAEFQSVMKAEEQKPVELRYPRNPDLDPQLVWRGKDEQDWSDLVVHAPPLYIQEKVHPKVLIDDLLKQTEKARKEADKAAGKKQQLDLFAAFNGVAEGADKTEFYQHDQNWTNRMILGDSLQVMASLAEREGLRGKVQCIYFDPPYGIKFNSNFQWSTTSRDVKDGKTDHITREPEQVKAFRDTWRDGIHSYLTYLRDRLTVMRDLLTESGSIFVQIGDENVHRVRALMDEVFGESNFVSLILFRKTGGLTASFMPTIGDYLLWYAKDRPRAKFRRAFKKKSPGDPGATQYRFILHDDLRLEETGDPTSSAREGVDLCAHADLTSQGNESYEFSYVGRSFRGGFKPSPSNMPRLARAGRLHVSGNSLRYVRKLSDYDVYEINHLWEDVGISGFADPKVYVVQTTPLVVQRCLLMATDPGDLVLDPTCGSGTAATVAEQWGRRWITIDTSRVALALARARIMGSRYPFYLLADSREGQLKESEIGSKEPSVQPRHGNVRHGFVYERVPHITLKSIANNVEIDVIWERWQATLESLRAMFNAATKKQWQEWEIPREADKVWPEATKKLHADWWTARIARQKEIDASIAAKAEFEFLYDRPYEDKKTVRVAGPFTVESLSPHRMLGVDENDELIDSVRETGPDYPAKRSFPQIILDNLKVAGVQQAHKEDRITFTSLVPWPGELVCGEGRYLEGSTEKRAAIFIGPEFGTVQRADLVAAAREAGDAGFDVLIACAFNYEAHTTEFNKLGRIPVLKARMNADLHMAEDLKNTGKGNLFVVFGEPDLRILVGGTDETRAEMDRRASRLAELRARDLEKALRHAADDRERANLQRQIRDRDRLARSIPKIRELPSGKLMVEVWGVDVFKPQSGEVESSDTDGIACWFVDTDYNEESFFVRHAYFLGANDPYNALKTTLKAEIDADAWATLHSDTSRPFDKPSKGRIAVKVINHLGDEVMKVFKV